MTASSPPLMTPRTKIKKKHPPFSSHLPTTMYDTIVDYFLVSKIITPDITQCTTHFNSWHSLPPIHPIIAKKSGQRYPVHTDHNLISISLLLPSHPPLGSSHLSDKQCPVRQAYHSWKLKYGNIQKSLREDLDLNASSILPTLQNILDNTKNLSPQARAELCIIVGYVLLESASSVLSSPNFQPHHTHSRQPTSATPTHPPGHKHTNPTPDAKTLRAEIQNLRNTISAKSNENSHNPLLSNLKLQLNQKRKTLKQVYRKQNSAHLLAHAHELKVTPFTTTINTAWKLLCDYKGENSSASPQLPSQMRTNISADKRMWTEGDIQREPHIGIRSWHQHRYHLGHDLRNHPLSPWDETETDRVTQTLNAPHPSDSQIPDPER